MSVQALSAAWEDVYHANLINARLAADMELINHTFKLQPFFHIDERAVTNPVRAFRHEFSRLMADWILSGKVAVSEEMKALNPNAGNFGTMFNDILCTAYGPRILEQVPFVVRELQRNPDSRRACIMMLGTDDRHVADALHAGTTNCEYMCTYAFNFRVRNGALDMTVSMRSNNYTTTVCQDVYVFARLQEKVADLLQVAVGAYYHHTVSGHIFNGEAPKADAILKAYVTEHAGPNYDGPQFSEANGWLGAIRCLRNEGAW